jgi:hypothetical protein
VRQILLGDDDTQIHRRHFLRAVGLAGAGAVGLAALEPSDALAFTLNELEEKLREVNGGSYLNVGLAGAFPHIASKEKEGKKEGYCNLLVGTGATALTTMQYAIGVGYGSLRNAKIGFAINSFGVENLAAFEEGEYVEAYGGNTLLEVKKTSGELWIGNSAGEQYLGNGESGGQIVLGENTMCGIGAGVEMKKGRYNTGFGRATLTVNEGNQNNAFGYASLHENTTGSGNVGLGEASLESNKTGSYNTAIGVEVGKEVTGSDNVLIGYQTAYTQKAISNQLWIANSDTSGPLIHGEFPNSALTFNTEKIALYKGVTPVVRAATIPSLSVSTATVKECAERINALITAIKGVGLTK